jgi:hypothetical protein
MDSENNTRGSTTKMKEAADRVNADSIDPAGAKLIRR